MPLRGSRGKAITHRQSLCHTGNTGQSDATIVCHRLRLCAIQSIVLSLRVCPSQVAGTRQSLTGRACATQESQVQAMQLSCATGYACVRFSPARLSRATATSNGRHKAATHRQSLCHTGNTGQSDATIVWHRLRLCAIQSSAFGSCDCNLEWQAQGSHAQAEPVSHRNHRTQWTQRRGSVSQTLCQWTTSSKKKGSIPRWNRAFSPCCIVSGVDLVPFAAFPRQERVGLTVTDDLSFGRIPAQFSIEPHGDIRQVADFQHPVV